MNNPQTPCNENQRHNGDAELFWDAGHSDDQLGKYHSQTDGNSCTYDIPENICFYCSDDGNAKKVWVLNIVEDTVND